MAGGVLHMLGGDTKIPRCMDADVKCFVSCFRVVPGTA